MLQLSMVRGLAVTLALGLVACSKEVVVPKVAHLVITPLPEGTQTAVKDPPELDFHDVPLYSVVIGTFELENDARVATLTIDSATVATQNNGVFTVGSYPTTIKATEKANMVVTFSPTVEGLPASATIVLAVNLGSGRTSTAEIKLNGQGVFLGEPNLAVCYGGTCHQIPEACTPQDGVCVLPELDFGNVLLDTTATQFVRLQNVAEAGTCRPPPTDEACTPECVVTFDKDATADNLGIGVGDTTSGFGLATNPTLPLALGTNDPACVGTVATGDTLRDDERIPVAFAAGSTERLDVASTLVLESSQPGAPRIRVPLAASARLTPVAVAKLRACDTNNPPPSCSIADSIRPLDYVYFDGRDSYDPSGGTINTYSWSILDAPSGFDRDTYTFVPDETTPLPSLQAVVAGHYAVRLQVTNGAGLQSGASDTSDVEFDVVPDSRLHAELVWDDPVSDLDLHLIDAGDAGTSDLVYSAATDCFWANCKAACLTDGNCTPVKWYTNSDPQVGPNPHLDIDDTNGLGPENINVDAPQPGRYRIYVHHYALTGGNGDDTVATVRIYLEGALKAELRRKIGRNDLWRVAEIEWRDDDTGVIYLPTPDAPGEVGQVKYLEYNAYPDGYDFGTFERASTAPNQQ